MHEVLGHKVLVETAEVLLNILNLLSLIVTLSSTYCYMSIVICQIPVMFIAIEYIDIFIALTKFIISEVRLSAHCESKYIYK